jgi:hypothetical protein
VVALNPSKIRQLRILSTCHAVARFRRIKDESVVVIDTQVPRIRKPSRIRSADDSWIAGESADEQAKKR